MAEEMIDVKAKVKQPDVVDKFRVFWSSLDYVEASQLWNILSAGRHSDTDTASKQMTTGRIRFGIFGGYDRNTATGVIDTMALTKPEIKDRDAGLKKETIHFIDHFTKALEILVSLGKLPKSESYRLKKVKV